MSIFTEACRGNPSSPAFSPLTVCRPDSDSVRWYDFFFVILIGISPVIFRDAEQLVRGRLHIFFSLKGCEENLPAGAGFLKFGYF